MKSRATLLIGAVLVSPAWSQQPATQTAALTPQSFDRSSDAIKKILRDTAATQSATVQLSEEKPAKRDPAIFVYLPPIPAEPVKIPTPRLPAPAPPSNSFVSQLIDILLDVDSDEVWQPPQLNCQADDVTADTRRFEMCPGQYHAGPQNSAPLKGGN